jgi:hypothetical protein
MTKAPRVAHYGRNGRRFAAASTHEGYGIPANMRIKVKAPTHTYEQCEAFLTGDREKTVASNVKVVRLTEDSIAIRLYRTDIITYYRDGTFSWTNGGYYTPTTSARANQFGPEGVWFGNHNLMLYANGTAEGVGVRLRVPVRPD